MSEDSPLGLLVIALFVLPVLGGLYEGWKAGKR